MLFFGKNLSRNSFLPGELLFPDGIISFVRSSMQFFMPNFMQVWLLRQSCIFRENFVVYDGLDKVTVFDVEITIINAVLVKKSFLVT